jgi:hypothetical protein
MVLCLPITTDLVFDMTIPSDVIDESFFELLTKAQLEALTEREIIIFNLRYGIGPCDRRHTLQEIGNLIGVSRERIRQILVKCERKLKRRAYTQEKRGIIDNATVLLLQYTRRIVKPADPEVINRLIHLIRSEESAFYQKEHLIELIVHFLYSDDEGKNIISAVGQRLQIHEPVISENTRRLFSRILWPKAIETITDAYMQSLRRTRETRQISPKELETPSNIRFGEYFSQKTSRIVQYESVSEQIFLRQLELHPDVLFYQEQPFSIEYEGLNKGVYQYHPDIFIVLQDRRGFVVEIKPSFDMPLFRNVIKGRALWRFCKDNGFGMLITDGRRDIIELRDRQVSLEAEIALLTRLDQGELKWDEYSEIRDHFQISTLDFLAIVLKNRLIWKRQPFLIKKAIE